MKTPATINLSKQERESGAKFQQLLRDRSLQCPAENYDESFAAVANSTALLAGMKRAEQFVFEQQPGGHSRREDWSPEFRAKMKAASEAESAPMSERHDPQLEAKSKKDFEQLVERLALEAGVNKDGLRLWAKDHHPGARKLWETYQHQKFLGRKQTLLSRQQQGLTA